MNNQLIEKPLFGAIPDDISLITVYYGEELICCALADSDQTVFTVRAHREQFTPFCQLLNQRGFYTDDPIPDPPTEPFIYVFWRLL